MWLLLTDPRMESDNSFIIQILDEGEIQHLRRVGGATEIQLRPHYAATGKPFTNTGMMYIAAETPAVIVQQMLDQSSVLNHINDTTKE